MIEMPKVTGNNECIRIGPVPSFCRQPAQKESGIAVRASVRGQDMLAGVPDDILSAAISQKG